MQPDFYTSDEEDDELKIVAATIMKEGSGDAKWKRPPNPLTRETESETRQSAGGEKSVAIQKLLGLDTTSQPVQEATNDAALRVERAVEAGGEESQE